MCFVKWSHINRHYYPFFKYELIKTATHLYTHTSVSYPVPDRPSVYH